MGHDYKISVEFWNKIKPLLLLPKPKEKPGRSREDDWKILNGIYYILRTDCQWKGCQDVMEHQVLSIIDSKNGGNMDYLKECGKLVC